jgi:hypothetical protein
MATMPTGRIGGRWLLTTALMMTVVVSGTARAESAEPSSPPPNDLPINATPVGPGFEETIDTSGARTNDKEELVFVDGCGFDGWDRAVWYKFKAAVDTNVHVDTDGSDYPAALAVTTGPLRNFNVYDCGGLSTPLDFPALAGQTYFVGAVDYDFMPDAKMLHVAFSRGLPEPRAQATVDWRAALTDAGAIRLHGKYTCVNGDQVWIQPFVTQPRRSSAKNYRFAADCDGALHPWRTVIPSTAPSFRPGWAFVELTYITACAKGRECGPETSNPKLLITLHRQAARAELSGARSRAMSRAPSPPPPNDLPINATPAGPGFEETINTSGARTNAKEASLFDQCGFDGNYRAVWYKITSERDTLVHVDTLGSDYFAAMAVATGPLRAFGLYRCAASQVDFPALARQTYFVGVVDYDLMPDAKMLHIAFKPGPPEQRAQATVKWRAALTADGAVRLRGTYTCRDASAVAIQPSVTQPRRQGGENFVISPADCDGALHPWSTLVRDGFGHAYRAGWAFVELDYITGCTPGRFCGESPSNPAQMITLYRSNP